MDYARALGLAEALRDELRAACGRIEIAGSVRRRKADVGDIEILAIPALELYQRRDLFGEALEATPVNMVEARLGRLIEAGPSAFEWIYDQVTPRDGPRYKRLHHTSGICCDLFLTTPERWGYLLAVRTGPADFSKELVTLALRLGWHFSGCMLHRHPKVGGKACPKGERCPLIVPTPEEGDVFEALGIPMPRPEDRTAELLRRVVAR